MASFRAGGKAATPPSFISRPTASAVLFAVALVAIRGGCLVAAQTATAGSACQSLLKAGISGTVNTTQYTFSVINQAACLDYSTYAFSSYQSDTSGANPVGTAFPLNLASIIFGWGGANYIWGATTLQSEIQFNDAKAKAAAYRATVCVASTITSATDPSVVLLSQFLDGGVYGAYVSCIKIYNTGLKMIQNAALSPKSLTIDVKFNPVSGGPAKVYFMSLSVFPKNTAGCVVYRTDSTMTVAAAAARLDAQFAEQAALDLGGQVGVAAVAPPRPPPSPKRPPSPPAYDPFRFEVLNNIPYTVYCSINPNLAGSSTEYADITIYTTVGTNFHALLFNPDPSNMTAITSSVTRRLTVLEGQVANLTARVQVLENQAAARG